MRLVEQRKPKILVVDDHEDQRVLATLRLRSHGYDTASAEDGAHALAYLASHDLPDAILLDLRMPVIDGWEFLTRQRQSPAIANVPVVVFTCDPPPYPSRSFAPNVVRCINKLGGKSLLLGAIDDALGHSPGLFPPPC